MAKKNQSVKDCKRAAYAAFPHHIDLRIGYENECQRTRGARPVDACDYLENILAGGDQSSIGYFAIDCDPTSGYGSELVSGSALGDKQNQKRLFFILAIALVAIALIWYM